MTHRLALLLALIFCLFGSWDGVQTAAAAADAGAVTNTPTTPPDAKTPPKPDINLPEGEGCTPGQYMSDKGDNKYACSKMPKCKSGESMRYVDNKYTCIKVSECKEGELLSFDGKEFKCLKDPDTCKDGQVPTFDGTNKTTCKKMATCKKDQQMRYINGQFKCLTIPKCGLNGNLTFNGTAFVCQD
jgi:hypothetical protein